VLPGVTWALHGVTGCYLGFYFGVVFFVVPKYPRCSNSKFWEKINFHLEMLPGPTPVVVACLLGPPSVMRVTLYEFMRVTLYEFMRVTLYELLVESK
jgi:hypothetical protein